MATQYGTLTAFDPSSDSIKSYLERVRLYFIANKVAEDIQVPILLSSIGPSTYALLCDLLAPSMPSSKSLPEITETMRRHFEPKRVVIAERFHFHKRDQEGGETIAAYDASLRKLATHCNFEGYLEEALRDRFVCGLRHEAIQRRLLSEVDLTYSRAVEIAQAMEAADRNTKEFHTSECSTCINKVSKVPPSSKENQTCYRCNRSGHSSNSCRFKEVTCHACKKKGHIAAACRSKRSSPAPTRSRESTPVHSHKTHQMKSELCVEEAVSSGDEYFLHNVIGSSSKPLRVVLTVNGKLLEMELDTGADLSIISEETRKTLLPNLKIHKSTVSLKTYTGEPIKLVGNLHVRVQYQGQQARLVLIVVEGNGPSLLGRNWLKYLRLDWSTIARIHRVPKAITELLDKYKLLFAEGLGSVEPFRATLVAKPHAKPKFFKPRPVPFALREAVGQQLQQMEDEGVIERVDHSDWAAPIVIVPKKDGKLRICGDYKVTVNSELEVDQYPLPKPNELFATLAGGKIFTKLDLSQAYLQLQLEEASTPLVTVNTHQGLYRYKRLPFGVASAPSIFQKLMDTVLQGIPGVICYIDDILVSSTDEKSHLETLGEVFTRLQKHGFRLKEDKCVFMMPTVHYLGHQIDATGIHTAPEKVEAIVKAPPPKNLSELRSFLGLVNYYGKFISQLSTILHPLNSLLKSEAKWEWSVDCSHAFERVKKELSSTRVLSHYDPKLHLILATDASA